MTTDMTADDEFTGTIIGAHGLEWRFRVGEENGEVFAEGEDFEGRTLTVEVPDLATGLGLVAWIETAHRPRAQMVTQADIEAAADLVTAIQLGQADFARLARMHAAWRTRTETEAGADG